MERVKGEHEKFCHECGDIIRVKAEICPKCGVRQPFASPLDINQIKSFTGQGGPRSRVTAGILGILLGGLGIHKFYLGKPVWGVVYILLVWTFLPAILGLIEGLNFLVMSDKVFNDRHAGPAWRSQ